MIAKVLCSTAVIAALTVGACTAGASRPREVATAESCKIQNETVRVRFSAARYPQFTRHLDQVRQDFPARLHKGEPGLSDRNRSESLGGLRTWGQLTDAEKKRVDRRYWQEPHDLDEYPPAMSEEGGRGAHVKFILSSENRSTGAVMGARLRPYCPGQAFRLVVVR